MMGTLMTAQRVKQNVSRRIVLAADPTNPCAEVLKGVLADFGNATAALNAAHKDSRRRLPE